MPISFFDGSSPSNQHAHLSDHLGNGRSRNVNVCRRRWLSRHLYVPSGIVNCQAFPVGRFANFSSDPLNRDPVRPSRNSVPGGYGREIDRMWRGIGNWLKRTRFRQRILSRLSLVVDAERQRNRVLQIGTDLTAGSHASRAELTTVERITTFRTPIGTPSDTGRFRRLSHRVYADRVVGGHRDYRVKLELRLASARGRAAGRKRSRPDDAV